MDVSEWVVTLSVLALVLSFGALVTTLHVLHNVRETLKLLDVFQRHAMAELERIEIEAPDENR